MSGYMRVQAGTRGGEAPGTLIVENEILVSTPAHRRINKKDDAS